MAKKVNIVFLREILINNYVDPAELTLMLELSVEELVKAFPHKLIEHQNKFTDDYVFEDEEDIDDEES